MDLFFQHRFAAKVQSGICAESDDIFVMCEEMVVLLFFCLHLYVYWFLVIWFFFLQIKVLHDIDAQKNRFWNGILYVIEDEEISRCFGVHVLWLNFVCFVWMENIWYMHSVPHPSNHLLNIMVFDRIIWFHFVFKYNQLPQQFHLIQMFDFVH